MDIGKLVPVLLVVMITTFNSCKRSDSSDGQFCSLMQQGKLNEASAYADNFLKSLPENSNHQLELFSAWLNQNSCVQTVSIDCRSCVKTYPPMSVMAMKYVGATAPKKVEIDIRMAKKLSCDIHD